MQGHDGGPKDGFKYVFCYPAGEKLLPEPEHTDLAGRPIPRMHAPPTLLHLQLYIEGHVSSWPGVDDCDPLVAIIRERCEQALQGMPPDHVLEEFPELGERIRQGYYNTQN